MKKNSKCSYIPVLSKMAKATMLAFSVLLLTVNTANAADFPSFEDGEKYLNHVNDANPGKNLIVNPSFNVCAKDIKNGDFTAVYELSDFVHDAGNTCNATNSGKDYLWGWFWASAQRKSGQSTTSYAPTLTGGYDNDAALSNYVKATKTTRLQKPISVVGVSEIYVSYWQWNNPIQGFATTLELDDGNVEINVTNATENTNWREIT